jgi:hypothetical protein
MKFQFGFLVALSILTPIGTSAGIAREQPVEFGCPEVRTVVEIGVYKNRYLGASADEPYLQFSEFLEQAAGSFVQLLRGRPAGRGLG